MAKESVQFVTLTTLITVYYAYSQTPELYFHL